MMNDIFKSSAIAIAVSLFVTGCDVSIDTDVDDKDDDYTKPLLTGVFLDSAVEGIRYKTESEAGMTDNQGMFYYREGEMITFSIGDVALPTAQAMPVLKPTDLIGSNATADDPAVINILQLLQSLDEDGNPENGIYINSLAESEFMGESLDFFADDFDTKLTVLLDDLGNISLVSEQDALDHFLGTTPLQSQDSLQGSWIYKDISASGELVEFAVLTFLPNHRYLLTQPIYETDSDQAGGAGEFGQYAYSAASGEFKVQLISESDGDAGLVNGDRPVERFIRFDDNGQLTISGKEAQDDGQGGWDSSSWEDFSVVLENAFNPSDDTTGSWLVTETNDAGEIQPDTFNVVTLLGNGEYVISHSTNKEAYSGASAVQVSSEWGFYTDAGSDTNIVFSTPEADLDGPGGFYDAESDPMSSVSNLTIAMNGDLVITELTDDGSKESFNVQPIFYPKKLTTADITAGTYEFTYHNPASNADSDAGTSTGISTGQFTFDSGFANVFWNNDTTDSEMFDWTITDEGKLAFYLQTAAGLPEIYTLVGGSFGNGYLQLEKPSDDNAHVDMMHDIVTVKPVVDIDDDTDNDTGSDDNTVTDVTKILVFEAETAGTFFDQSGDEQTLKAVTNNVTNEADDTSLNSDLKTPINNLGDIRHGDDLSTTDYSEFDLAVMAQDINWNDVVSLNIRVHSSHRGGNGNALLVQVDGVDAGSIIPVSSDTSATGWHKYYWSDWATLTVPDSGEMSNLRIYLRSFMNIDRYELEVVYKPSVN